MSQDISCPKCKSPSVKPSSKENVLICEKCGNAFSSRPVHLFFSYGHDANEPLVNKIKADLEARGHTIWIDKYEIKGGDDWRRSIFEGLNDTHAVMAFLSKYAVRIEKIESKESKGVCIDELTIAVGVKYGNIKTVLVENESTFDIPPLITERNWVDMHDWQERKKGNECESWYQAKLQEIIEIVESDETAAYVMELDKIREALSVELSDVSEVKEQKLLEQPMIGRKWLMTELETWRTNEPASRVFLLYGDPGVGKSRFAADLMHRKENKAIAGFYCVKGKDTYNRADTIAKILAVKIAARLPDYRKLLLALVSDLEKYEKDDTGVDWFDKLLIHPLNHLIDGNRDRFYLVIDGLDEAEVHGMNVLALTLARILKDLPSWLGVVITSRPESDITTAFGGYHPHILDAGSEQNLQDIREYLADSLNNIFDQNQDLDRNVVLDNLVKASEGSFLYAVSVVQEIRENAFDLTNPDAYPRGMNGFYAANFARKFEKDEEFEKVYPALSLLVAADSLPIPLMEDVLEKNGHQSLREFRVFETKLGSFLRRNPNVIRKDEELGFYHKCLGDWLKNRKDNPKFYVDPRDGGRLLARYAREKIGKNKRIDPETKQPEYLVYLQNNIVCYYLASKDDDELNAFLQEEDTSIFPYWYQAVAGLPQFADRMRVRINTLVENVATKELLMDLNITAILFEKNYMFGIADQMYQHMIAACRNLPNQKAAETQAILVAGLFRYGKFSFGLNHYVEAEPVLTEALAIQKELAKSNPDAYLPDVGDTLNYLGGVYYYTNQLQKAEDAYNEALAIRKELAKSNPDAYLPDIALILNSKGSLYEKLNQFQKAENAYTEALEIARKLAERNPDAHHHDVALILNNLGHLYIKLNQVHKAEYLLTEALEIARKLAERNPDAHHQNVAIILNNLGILYNKLNQMQKAEHAFTEALDIYKNLAESESDVYLLDVFLILNSLASLYKNIGHSREANKSVNEAKMIKKKLRGKYRKT